MTRNVGPGIRYFSRARAFRPWLLLWVGLGFIFPVVADGPGGKDNGTSEPNASAAVHTHEMLNAVLWQRTSAEFEALSLQAYATARANLSRALGDASWTAALEQGAGYQALPPAVILDLDDTVLDSSGFQAGLVAEQARFTPEAFQRWCERDSAPALPGAVSFINLARRRGVTVFFVSARREALRECTRENLRRLGLSATDDGHLLLGPGRKSEHRRFVASSHRVLLLVGDNLDDFVPGSRVEPSRRKALVRSHSGYWGQRWIVLPNPMYGHWDAAWFGFDYELPRREVLERKLRVMEESRRR